MVSRLLATKQGCEWLLERWQALGAALMERGTWTEAQRVLAVNLLGTPAEFRDDPVWHAPADVVSDEVARLLLLKSTALDPLDALERAAAEKGLAVEPSEALTKVRRYEAACMRQFQWAHNRLLGRPADPRRASPSRERRRGPIARDVGMRAACAGAQRRPAPRRRRPDRAATPTRPRRRRLCRTTRSVPEPVKATAPGSRVPAQSRADRNQPFPKASSAR